MKCNVSSIMDPVTSAFVIDRWFTMDFLISLRDVGCEQLNGSQVAARSSKFYCLLQPCMIFATFKATVQVPCLCDHARKLKMTFEEGYSS